MRGYSRGADRHTMIAAILAAMRFNAIEMIMLDIHALQVFYEAAQAGNFTSAAHKLNMTQPAVSMQIKSLEYYLQVKLFERNGRGMQLTKAGQALVPHAREILEMTNRTEEFIRRANDEVLGDLIVGCSLPSADNVLIHLAARFQQLYPLVKIHIPTVSKEELIDKILSGQYDLGVMHVLKDCHGLECLPFFKDQIVLIASADHPLNRETRVAPAALVGQRFVCQHEGAACRDAVREAFKPYGIDITQFDVRMEIGNHSAIVAAVEHGVGLAFVSRLEAAPGLARGSIRIVEIDGINLMTSIGLAYSTAHSASLARMKFKAFLAHERTHVEISRMTQEVYAITRENSNRA